MNYKESPGLMAAMVGSIDLVCLNQTQGWSYVGATNTFNNH